MDPFLGQIILFAGTFAPQGWAFCQGQTMAISQNTALFSLLGTTYGGNGTTTFNLPDLRGRVPVGMGQGPGLPNIVEGQLAGTASVLLTTQNLPAHTHSFAQNVSANPADQTSPVNAIPAVPSATLGSGHTPATPTYGYTQTAATGTHAAQQTGVAGGNQPVSTMPPYLGLNYIIALAGIFPPRS